jgi:putative acetyltransferase
MDVAVRAARDEDAEQLITLIGGCFAEYPGCILEVDGEMPELRAIATFFTTRQGHFWVAERAGQVVGSVGVLPTAAPKGMELRKLYVARAARRRGLGGHLCDLAEAHARACGAVFIELWSDTRFTDAHRLYERRGYVRGAETRALYDLSQTIEFYFRKPL